MKENLLLGINIIISKEQCEEFMDFNSQNREDLEVLSKDLLNLNRKEKLLKEIETARKLLEEGIEPLKVADNFFHDTFKIIEQGIMDNNPEFTIEEVKKKVRENINFAYKIKSHRRRG